MLFGERMWSAMERDDLLYSGDMTLQAIRAAEEKNQFRREFRALPSFLSRSSTN